MSYIYIPAKNAGDWAQVPADPVKHWRTGYSARTLASSWQDADGFPAEVQGAFSSNEFLSDIQMLIGIPEHQVPLAGGSRSAEIAINRVVYAGKRGGVHLHIGWICGNEKYLNK